MGKKQAGIPDELREAINEAARAGAHEAAASGAGVYVNYFKAMESLLYNYKRLAALIADESGYMHVEIQGRSMSMVTAAESGGEYKSQDERLEEMRAEKERQYQKTKFGFERLDRVIRLYADRKEFCVIRMYYFGEDINGDPLEDGMKYTWEQVAEACEEAGLLKEVKTARRWRNRIVNDMAVCVFGLPAAVSAGTHRPMLRDQMATFS